MGRVHLAFGGDGCTVLKLRATQDPSVCECVCVYVSV